MMRNSIAWLCALALVAPLMAVSGARAQGELSLDDLQDEDTSDIPRDVGTGPGADDEEELLELSFEDNTPAEAPVTGKTATDEGIDLTLQDRIKAVARKTFLKANRFELVPMAGVTMNDAFFQTWAVGGRLSYHLHDAFALEVGGMYVPPGFAQTLEPVQVLRNELKMINTDNKLIGMADIGFTFSPMYGKVALFGDAIIHFDGFLQGGVGATFDNGADLVHPAMNVGAGVRVFLLRWLALRADVRDVIYPQDKLQISTLQNLLFVNLGVAFYLPFDFEYQYEAARVNQNG
jgi:outer membrane beta-barrel protein